MPRRVRGRGSRIAAARLRPKTALASLIACSAIIAACGGGPATSPQGASDTSLPSLGAPHPAAGALEQLQAARDTWAAAGLDTFRYVFADDCGECDAGASAPQEVVVWDGEEIDPGGRSPSVAEVFDRIEQAILDGLVTDVVYHPELGYPLDVAIDMEARAYDGGTHWVLQDLEPGLPGDPVSLEAVLAAEERWRAVGPHAYEYTMTVRCECSLAGSIRTRVDGRQVVELQRDFEDPLGDGVSSIAMDAVFADLVEMLSSADGVLAGGVRFQGSARFDPVVGVPTWIGLDITVEEDSAELAYLPERLVLVITDFVEVPSQGDSDSALNDRDAAMVRWHEAGIDSYRYELTLHDVASGDFGDPHLVTVRSGSVASVTQNALPVDALGVPAHAIDDLFILMELWRQQGSEVEGIFNAELGYPVVVSVRPIDSSDGGQFFSIQNLLPIP